MLLPLFPNFPLVYFSRSDWNASISSTPGAFSSTSPTPPKPLRCVPSAAREFRGSRPQGSRRNARMEEPCESSVPPVTRGSSPPIRIFQAL